MNVLVYLVPLALGLGLTACLRFYGLFVAVNTATSMERPCASCRMMIFTKPVQQRTRSTWYDGFVVPKEKGRR
jgi:hypothetical protein